MKKTIPLILLIIQFFSFDIYSQNRGNWTDISPYPAHLVGNGCIIKFFDKDTGYVYTDELINSRIEDCLYQTNDGGNNWTRKKVVRVGSDNCLFFNKKIGFYKFGNDIYKTIDGGDSFDLIKSFPFGNSAIIYNSSNSIFAFGNYNSSNYDSMRTFIGKDYGSSWKQCYDTLIWGIHFIDSLNGYGFKSSKPPFLIKTTDGGEHWLKTYKLPNIAKIKFVTIDTGYIIGNSKLYISTNSGQTWDSIMNGIHNSQCYDITCINSKTCFVAGYDLINKKSEIYKTTNAGQSWKSISEGKHFTTGCNRIQYVIDSSKDVTIFISAYDGFHTPIYKATFDPVEIWGDIENPINTVSKFELYPNPSNGSVNVNLTLNHTASVNLLVNDVLGKEIINLKLNNFKEGVVPVDMSNYSGIFFFNIKTDKDIVSKKIILTK